MFETVIVQAINRYLGDYVENLQSSQLEISLLKGNIHLDKLDIKPNALDNLDLPIKIIQGHIGSLDVQIPWKNLFTEPTIAELDGLYILAVPNLSTQYNAEKEAQYLQETKQRELRHIEEAKQLADTVKEKDSGKSDGKQTTFVERFAMQVMKNLQIRIRNIHIRYEDKFNCPEHPFSFGITLHSLSFQTTNGQWEPCVIKEEVTKQFNKLVQIESLAAYWNSDDDLYSNLSATENNKALVKKKMRDNIASPDKESEDYRYVLQPTTSKARFRYEARPEESQFSVPMMQLDVDLEDICVSVANNQYVNAILLTESLDRMVTANKYRKHRPAAANSPRPINERNRRQWWTFLRGVILEDMVRQRRRMWSWQYIRQHREKCRRYREVFKLNLQGKIKAKEKKELEQLENELDVFNITLWRKQAEIQAKKDAKAASRGGGWLRGWWGGGGQPSDTNKEVGVAGSGASLTARVNNLTGYLAEDEKQALYRAINYSEEGAVTAFPAHYVATRLKVKLSRLSIMLGTKSLPVASLDLKTVTTLIEQRPAAKAIKVAGGLASLTVFGSPWFSNGVQQVPCLVETINTASTTSAVGEEQSGSLLQFEFQTNPLDQKCDQLISISADTLKIVYDAQTIEKIMQFVEPSAEVQLKELSAAVASSLEEAKQMTATGLKHVIEERFYTAVLIDVKPSYVVLPEYGRMTDSCKRLVVVLGTVNMQSERQAADLDKEEFRRSGSLDFEKMKEQAYDKYELRISNMCIMYSQSDLEDVSDEHNHSNKSSHHVLLPMSLDFNLEKCLVVDDPRLPKIRLRGALPSLELNAEDDLLHNVLALLLSVPTPASTTTSSPAAPPPVLENFGHLTSNQNNDSLLFLHSMDDFKVSDDASDSDNEKHFEIALESLPTSSTTKVSKSKTRTAAELVNFFDLELIFSISKICVHLGSSKSACGEFCLLLENINMTLAQHTFDLRINASLSSLLFNHTVDTEVRSLLSTKLPNENCKLFNISVHMVQQNHPLLQSSFNGVHQTVVLAMSVLALNLIQESLLDLMKYLHSQTKLLEEAASSRGFDATPAAAGQVALDEKKESGLVATGADRGSNVKMRIRAHLDRVEVKMSNKERKFAKMNIRGVSADVFMESATTLVSLSLVSIEIADPTPNFYSRILWIEATDKLVQCSVVLYNKDSATASALQPDISIELQVGRINIVFIYAFLSRLVTYFDPFQEAKMRLMQEAAILSESTLSSVQNAYQNQTMLTMSIDLLAPLIYMPRNSRSNDALLVNLGKLELRNRFDLQALTGDAAAASVLLDHMQIHLIDLQICRCKMNDINVVTQQTLLPSVKTQVNIDRNLSLWYDKIPDVAITIDVELFQFTLTQDDYALLMACLSENFAEDVASQSVASNNVVARPAAKSSESAAGVVAADEKTVAIVAVKSESEASSTAAASLTLKFHLKCIALELYKGKRDMESTTSCPSKEHHLARLEICNVTANGLINKNMSMHFDACVEDLILHDARINAFKSITNGVVIRVIRSTKLSKTALLSLQFNSSTPKQKTIDIVMCQLYVFVCAEYLKQISEFFILEVDEAASRETKANTAATMLKTMETSNAVTTSASSTRRDMAPVEQPPQYDPEEDIRVIIRIQQPEILLVRDMHSEDTTVVLLRTEGKLDLRIVGSSQHLNMHLSNISVISCPFLESRRAGQTMQVLAPCSVSVNANGQRPFDSMHIAVTISDIEVHISPVVINALTVISTTLTSASIDDTQVKEQLHDEVSPDLWQKKSLCKLKKCWYLTSLADDAALRAIENESDKVSVGVDVADSMTTQVLDESQKEQVIMEISSIRVMLECEVGRKNVPMLKTETAVQMFVQNWSSNIYLRVELQLTMQYYNDQLNEWEPLLEPVQTAITKKNASGYKPYEVLLEVRRNEDRLQIDETDSDDVERSAASVIQPARLSVEIKSSDSLQLTLTKTGLNVLLFLGSSFKEAYVSTDVPVVSSAQAPFAFINLLGVAAEIKLDSGLQPLEPDIATSTCAANGLLSMVSGAKVYLIPVGDDQKKVFHLSVSLKDDLFKSQSRHVHLDRSERLLLAASTQAGFEMYYVAETSAFLGAKTLSLRSPIKLLNCTNYGLEVYSGGGTTFLNRLKEREMLGAECPGQLCLSLATAYNAAKALCFRADMEGYQISSSFVNWQEVKPERVVLISSTKPNGTTLYFNVLVETEKCHAMMTEEKSVVVADRFSLRQPANQTSVSNETQLLYNVVVRPPLRIDNQLPIALDFFWRYDKISSTQKTLAPGQSDEIYELNPESGRLELELPTYNGQERWSACLELQHLREMLDKALVKRHLNGVDRVLTFHCQNGYDKQEMNLSINFTLEKGVYKIVIHSQYWFINKTESILEYKTLDNLIFEHTVENNSAILFTPPPGGVGKKNNTKRKCHAHQSPDGYESDENTCPNSVQSKPIAKYCKIALRLNKKSNWSDKFNLDTVGHVGTVVCKQEKTIFQIGVEISLSSSGLTKIVTFLPYFMLVNKSPLNLSCAERSLQSDSTTSEDARWTLLPPGAAKPFWPLCSDPANMLMVVRVDDHKDLITKPFPMADSHSSLMRLDRLGGVFVDVNCSEDATVITLQEYCDGMAPALIINNLPSSSVTVYQTGGNQHIVLEPQTSILFSWENMQLKREITYVCQGCAPRSVTLLDTAIFCGPDKEKAKQILVSFLDSSQRILLFTEDIAVATLAKTYADLERSDMEIQLKMDSVGLSLVNNSRRVEVAYISITSCLVWQEIVGRRQKPMKDSHSNYVEQLYQVFLLDVHMNQPKAEYNAFRDGKGGRTEFKLAFFDGDMLGTAKILKPYKKDLVRTFEPGIDCMYTVSAHKKQFRVKIFRFQVDCQLAEGEFPVIFAPVPLPKSMSRDGSKRPFFDLSAVLRVLDEDQDHQAIQCRYFKCLIMEMQVMSDLIFINELVEMFAGHTEEKKFTEDVHKIELHLIDSELAKTVSSGRRHFFDYLHITPIKLHLTFHLGKSNSDDLGATGGIIQAPNAIVQTTLKSLGVGTTSASNVILKLNCFERKNDFFTSQALINEITRHYTRQLIRQVYALVLGLDIIGNPITLARGMFQGVQDFFYEPIQGGIQGPNEFVEGVAVGARSLLGNSVGGAAGALGRITGTLGQVGALLTFDSDYQSKRRTALKRQPTDLGGGMLEAAKGLGAGIAGGISGVVLRPIEGASKEGGIGFIKGVGKGLVGLVSRPVTGVLDATAITLSAVQRSTDGVEMVTRVRPPRYLPSDVALQPYNRSAADANELLQQAESGRFRHEIFFSEALVLIRPVSGTPYQGWLILTNRSVILAKRSFVMTNWSIEWSLQWDNIRDVIADGAKLEIVLNTKKTGLFSRSQDFQRHVFELDDKRATSLRNEMKSSCKSLN